MLQLSIMVQNLVLLYSPEKLCYNPIIMLHLATLPDVPNKATAKLKSANASSSVEAMIETEKLSDSPERLEGRQSIRRPAFRRTVQSELTGLPERV